MKNEKKRKLMQTDAWRFELAIKSKYKTTKNFFSSEINNNKWMNEFISQQMEKQTENWIEQTIVIDLYNNYS